MNEKTTLTFAIMDPPFESARSTTFFRLLNVAASRGYNINVFAYEGGVHLPFNKQKRHANGVHGTTLEEENHPLPKEWVNELINIAKQNNGHIEWVNCGLCADERGIDETVSGVRRGSPADFWKLASASDNSLVIGTR
ncbi:MAG: DsrE family protein [Proteobacteria bacterium]|nr:FeS-binding protein [Pseudomonadota bacterium]NOG59929.1 DsrE family protein [Pseudomonadota bacterium]